MVLALGMMLDIGCPMAVVTGKRPAQGGPLGRIGVGAN
jgi:hypothetical protein